MKVRGKIPFNLPHQRTSFEQAPVHGPTTPVARGCVVDIGGSSFKGVCSSFHFWSKLLQVHRR